MSRNRETVLAALSRDLNFLTDADRFKRLSGISKLSNELFTVADTPADVRASILLNDAGASLHRLLADPVEGVREAAITLLARAAAADGGSLGFGGSLLAWLLPTAILRVGGHGAAAETAEELRLAWAQLLRALIERGVGAGTENGRESTTTSTHTREDPSGVSSLLSGGGASFASAADTLRALLGDSFHSVKLEAAAATVALARVAPARVASVLEGLTRAAVGALAHQRAPVRVAALTTLAALLPLGGEGLVTILHDIVFPPTLAHLRFDRTTTVRKALATTLAHWLSGALPPHALAARGTEPMLLLLTTALAADEDEHVACHAFQALEGAAAARDRDRDRDCERDGPADSQAATSVSISTDMAVAAASVAPPEGATAAALAEHARQALLLDATADAHLGRRGGGGARAARGRHSCRAF